MITVFILGPSLKTKGGISSVIRNHMEELSDKANLKHIPTYSGQNRLLDIVYFFISILRLLLTCLIGKRENTLFHIHASTYGSFFRKSVLLRICSMFHYPTVLQMHGADFDDYIEDVGAKKVVRILNHASKVLFLSESWLSDCMDKLPGLSADTDVLYNPCPRIPKQVRKEDFWNGKLQRAALEPAVRIIFTGQLGKRKGVYDLLEASSMLKDLNYEMMLYGDGELEKVDRLIQESGNRDKVKAINWADYETILDKYLEADIFVLPSYQEGMPMSLLEAMSRGLPVISTDIRGIRECVSDGINGYLLRPGDIRTLGDKLKTLIRNPELRLEMGKRSLEFAQDRFSGERIGESLLSQYRQLLAKRQDDI